MITQQKTIYYSAALKTKKTGISKWLHLKQSDRQTVADIWVRTRLPN